MKKPWHRRTRWRLTALLLLITALLIGYIQLKPTLRRWSLERALSLELTRVEIVPSGHVIATAILRYEPDHAGWLRLYCPTVLSDWADAFPTEGFAVLGIPEHCLADVHQPVSFWGPPGIRHVLYNEDLGDNAIHFSRLTDDPIRRPLAAKWYEGERIEDLITRLREYHDLSPDRPYLVYFDITSHFTPAIYDEVTRSDIRLQLAWPCHATDASVNAEYESQMLHGNEPTWQQRLRWRLHDQLELPYKGESQCVILQTNPLRLTAARPDVTHYRNRHTILDLLGFERALWTITVCWPLATFDIDLRLPALGTSPRPFTIQKKQPLTREERLQKFSF